MHSKLSNEQWVLDQSSIFAQVDAFVQRCKDLLEVLLLSKSLWVVLESVHTPRRRFGVKQEPPPLENSSCLA